MLLLVLDVSKGPGGTVFAVIVVEEGSYRKLRSIISSWIKHYKDLPSRRRRKYLLVFERKFNKIKDMLYCYGCFTRFDSVLRIIDLFAGKSKLIIVDDKFYTLIKSKYGGKVVAEGKAKPYYSAFILLADNLANLVRIKLSKAKSTLNKYKILEEYRKKK
ncbi:MAG: hypothetical protein DRN04_00335 [Thermoprotei archaeon]|nr:MAG: hypothetical protein DRN04_00335 [Thermoprotei archaeon]